MGKHASTLVPACSMLACSVSVAIPTCIRKPERVCLNSAGRQSWCWQTTPRCHVTHLTLPAHTYSQPYDPCHHRAAELVVADTRVTAAREFRQISMTAEQWVRQQF
jgi:hypothetical protein